MAKIVVYTRKPILFSFPQNDLEESFRLKVMDIYLPPNFNILVYTFENLLLT